MTLGKKLLKPEEYEKLMSSVTEDNAKAQKIKEDLLGIDRIILLLCNPESLGKTLFIPWAGLGLITFSFFSLMGAIDVPICIAVLIALVGFIMIFIPTVTFINLSRNIIILDKEKEQKLEELYNLLNDSKEA